MFKLKRSTRKVVQTEQGFTLFEVLVAIVIATAFVAVSMQAIVIAAMFKVKAQEKERANELIREDVEIVKEFAAADDTNIKLKEHSNRCFATVYDDGYANALWGRLPIKPADKDVTVNTGKKLALERIHFSEATATTSDAPYKTLKIKYEVKEWDSDTSSSVGEPVAEDYIEVIPDVALECP